MERPFCGGFRDTGIREAQVNFLRLSPSITDFPGVVDKGIALHLPGTVTADVTMVTALSN